VAGCPTDEAYAVLKVPITPISIGVPAGLDEVPPDALDEVPLDAFDAAVPEELDEQAANTGINISAPSAYIARRESTPHFLMTL
jgi:hypothetical protein